VAESENVPYGESVRTVGGVRKGDFGKGNIEHRTPNTERWNAFGVRCSMFGVSPFSPLGPHLPGVRFPYGSAGGL